MKETLLLMDKHPPLPTMTLKVPMDQSIDVARLSMTNENVSVFPFQQDKG